ncbi:MAG: hypothetical protein GF320_21370 [Armatimonadia bacterium]|nr:hypothetical protein [Armatimonadia bacterium]
MPSKIEVSTFLTGAAQELRPVPSFWNDYFIETPNAEGGQMVQFDRERPGDYKMAGFSTPGGPARIVGGHGWDTVNVRAARMREKLQAKGAAMKFLRAPGTRNEPIGQRLVLRGLRGMRNHFERRIVWLKSQVLSNPSTITVPMDEGTPTTFSNGVPADQIASTVSADWTVAGTDILGDLLGAQSAVDKNYNVAPSTVLMNYFTWRKTIAQNDEWSKWVTKDDRAVRQMIEGGFVAEFEGFRCVVLNTGNRVDTTDYGKTESLSKLLPDYRVVLLPSNPNETLELELVMCEPEDLEAPAGMRGFFSKSWTDPDPSAVWVLLNVELMPIMRRPAIYIFTNVTTTA